MFIFSRKFQLPLTANQTATKQRLLHSPLFNTKEENGTIILSRHRHIPKIPFINKLIRLFVARVTTTVYVENRSLQCKFSINRESVFGLIIILSGIGAHLTGVLVEEDIPPAFVYILAAIYFFFLIHEIYKNHSLIKTIQQTN